MSRARLKRHEHSRVRPRLSAKRSKGFDLGMRFAASPVITLGHDLSALNNQSADHRVRVGSPPPLASKLQYPPEKPLFLPVVQSHGFDRLAQGQRKPDRAMVGPLPFGKNASVPHRSGEIIGNDKVINPPPDVSGTGSGTVRPPGIGPFFIRVQMAEGIKKPFRQ